MTDNPRVLAAQLLAASRFAMPLQDALEQIRARRMELTQTQRAPTPDLAAAEEMPHPIVDAPEHFAAAFWKRRATPRALKRQPNQGKPAIAAAVKTTATPTLRIIDGGKGGAGDNGDGNS